MSAWSECHVWLQWKKNNRFTTLFFFNDINLITLILLLLKTYIQCNIKKKRVTWHGVEYYKNRHKFMRGSRGGVGGSLFTKLYIADITGNEKISHICALPQLYVKQNQSYLRLDPPWKNFLDPRLKLSRKWY